MRWKSGVIAAAIAAIAVVVARGRDRCRCAAGLRRRAADAPGRRARDPDRRGRARSLARRSGCRSCSAVRSPSPGCSRRARRFPVNAAVCVILIGVGLLCSEPAPQLGRRLRARRRADRGARAARLPLRGARSCSAGCARRRSRRWPLPTAFAMLALSAGVLAARTEGGLMALWSSDGPGGELVRRSAPAAIILPVALAFLSLEGQRTTCSGCARAWRCWAPA